MANSNPRALADFVDQLRIASCTWRAQRNDELSGLGSGQTVRAELATPLWAAEVGLIEMELAVARRVRALINSLTGPDRHFYLYDPAGKYPASDPTGSIIGSANVTIHTIASGGAQIRLTGLPSAYVLSPGDMLEISYGSNPERRGLFEVSEGSAVSGGLTPLFDIFPHLLPGIATGAVVNLKKPSAKVFIVPGSMKPGVEAKTTVKGMGFSAMQKL